MATVYSLICWGGKSGLTATISNATPAVVTITNHGLRDGAGVIFSTTGALPTGVTAGTTYYAKSTAANTFNLYDTAAHAIAGGSTGRVNTSSAGSGTHTATGAYWYGLSSGQKLRYGSAGSERAYNGIVAWNTGRAGASSYDTEIAEIGEDYDDTLTGALSITVPAASSIIWTKVDGVRSAGWHHRNFGAGYRLIQTGSGNAVALSKYNVIIDGIRYKTTSTNGKGIDLQKPGCILRGSLLWGNLGTGDGIVLTESTAWADSNIVRNFSAGISMAAFRLGIRASNNLLTGNTNGWTGPSGNMTNVSGFFYNNISIGNTANWGTAPGQIEGADKNAGLTGEAWLTGSGTRIVMATTDFASYSNASETAGDFAAASAGSPQVDTGAAFFGATNYDLDDVYRPSYNNGGADGYDVGPLERNNGFGLPPASGTLEGSGIIDGTRIKIAKQSDGAEIVNAVVSGTTKSDAFTGPDQAVYIYARKGSAAPFYKPVRISGSIVDGNLTYDLAGLQVEDIAVNGSYAAGVATDWTINTSTGAITHDSGTTRYTVQDLYSFHQNDIDDSATVDDDPLMDGTFDTIFKLINTGTISDADLQDLKGGSIEFQDGTLWSNVYNVPTGGLAGTPTVYLYQGTTKVTNFWAAGDFDLLLKVSTAGTPISSGLATGYARKWGYTYDHYQADLSGGGRNVMPLNTLADLNITDTAGTVGGWSDVTTTFGGISRDFGDGDGAQTYYLEIDCASRPLSEVYQRLQYICREGATGTLNGIAAETYQKAHASYTANKAAPFGSFAGGTLTCAQGIWLINVPAADATNYILTDHAGGVHQNEIVPGAANATVLAGSRVQLYNVDAATEIENVINADTSYSYSITMEASGGETLRLRVTKLGYEPVEVFGVFDATAGVTFLVTQGIDPIYAAWGLDGSTVTEYALDVTGAIEIDADDVDGASQKVRLCAFYAYALTTENGIRSAFGAMSFLAANAVRIEVPVVDMTVENINATTALRFTDNDFRLYRSDGTSIISPTSYSIHNDYSGVPDVVETGVSGLTGSESAQLMSLTNAPSAAAVAAQVLTAAQSTPIHANIKQVNSLAVDGTGTEADPWGPV